MVVVTVARPISVRTISAWTALAMFATSPLAALLDWAVAESLYLLPLVCGQLGPDGEQKARIRFLKLGTGGSDLVDLRQDCGFVGLIGAHQRLHLQFSLILRGAKVDELFAMREQDGVHRLALIFAQIQFLDDFWIVPELPVSTFEPECPFHGRPMLSEPRGDSGTAARSLRKCESARQGDGCQRQNQPYCKIAFHRFSSC
jgi:hypothetical protein